MYTDYFDLKEEPFRMTPDPRFMYFSSKHQEAFAVLLYGVNYRRGFVEITGDIGAGKTTLCRKLLAELDGKARTALILNPMLTDVQLLHAIVEDFGVRPTARNRKGYFDALNGFLLETAAQGLTSVLIVDEAQNLRPRTLEQIRLLSNLETDTEKLLQVILVGQPELQETLKQPSLAQLRQRIAVRHHLASLDGHETHEYIRHRLTVAGGEGKVFFEPEAVDRIHWLARGVPRLINSICDRAMLLAFVRETRTIDEAMVARAWNELEGKTR
jgi:general secretion pathway protein A